MPSSVAAPATQQACKRTGANLSISSSRPGRLYVAFGDPGVIDVIDVGVMRTAAVVPTERGAHTLALDRRSSQIYAFLPQLHRAAVLVDEA